MNLTTKSAQRLKELKKQLSDTYGIEHTDEYKMYGERNAIINFKNELKEIVFNNKQSSINKVLMLQKLVNEIESAEKS